MHHSAFLQLPLPVLVADISKSYEHPYQHMLSRDYWPIGINMDLMISESLLRSNFDCEPQGKNDASVYP